MPWSAALAVVDRAAVSLTSLLLTIAVARASSPGDFGRFTLALTAFVTVATAYRSVPGSWLITNDFRDSATDGPPRGSLGAALHLGMSGGILVATVAAASGLSWAGSALLGATAPAYLVVDACRLNHYRRGRVVRSAGLGVSVLLATALAVGPWLALGQPGGVLVPLMAYALAHYAVAAACLLAAPVRGLGIAATRAHLREHAADWLGQLGNVVVVTLTQLGVPSLLMVGGGPALVGAVRGAQTATSVPAQVTVGLQPILLRQLASARADGVPVRGHVRRWWLVTLAVMLPALAVFLVVPDPLGRQLLGQSWSGVSVALPWVVVSTVTTQLAVAYESVHRVSRRMRRFTGLRLVALVLVATGAVVGAQVAGVRGAACGLALGNGLSLAVMWLVSRRLMGGSRPGDVTAPAHDSPPVVAS